MQALSQLSYGPVKAKILYSNANLNPYRSVVPLLAAPPRAGARRIPERARCEGSSEVRVMPTGNPPDFQPFAEAHIASAPLGNGGYPIVLDAATEYSLS